MLKKQDVKLLQRHEKDTVHWTVTDKNNYESKGSFHKIQCPSLCIKKYELSYYIN